LPIGWGIELAIAPAISSPNREDHDPGGWVREGARVALPHNRIALERLRGR